MLSPKVLWLLIGALLGAFVWPKVKAHAPGI